MEISKYIYRESLAQHVSDLRTQNLKIVFTNGCFDLLHVGHVQYLEAARNLADCLILGLNSDASVRTIKGEKRPIIKEHHRLKVMSALSCVDFVTLFDEPDPLKLIEIVKPDFLVKGADWSEDNIIGGNFVKKNGGQIARIPVVPEISTTEIINKILSTYRS